MGEILDFQPKKKTAIGRFLLASEQQEHVKEKERLIKQARRKPTAEQSARAKRELDFIFSGDNKGEAEALYAEGLSDIVYRRKSDVTAEEKAKIVDQVASMFGVMVFGMVLPESTNYTPAAAFYAYVSNLQEIANHALDKFPEV